jgi:hypothetical protein
MFYTWYGADMCDICKHNEMDSCCHRAVNDALEIQKKSTRLQDILLRNKRQDMANDSLNLIDVIPDGPSDCFTGECDEKGLQVFEKKLLRDTFDSNGNPTLPINDYLRNIEHTEERDAVVSGSILVYQPSDPNKHTDITNIEYLACGDPIKDNQFHGAVLSDLILRGHKINTLPSDKNQRVKLLFGMLKERDTVYQLRNALKEFEIALKNRILDQSLEKMRFGKKCVSAFSHWAETQT